jgi:hypothetical protein
MTPALDAVLAVGDRVSRIVEPEDVDYYPPRVRRDEPRGSTRLGRVRTDPFIPPRRS